MENNEKIVTLYLSRNKLLLVKDCLEYLNKELESNDVTEIIEWFKQKLVEEN